MIKPVFKKGTETIIIVWRPNERLIGDLAISFLVRGRFIKYQSVLPSLSSAF